jgi:hypothetical protein
MEYFECLECKTKKLEIFICDNDCNTFICDKCNTEFYLNDKNELTKGHNPHCGIFSDIEVEEIDW